MKKLLHAQTGRMHSVNRMCGLLGISRQAYYKKDDSKCMVTYALEEFVVQFAKRYERRIRG